MKILGNIRPSSAGLDFKETYAWTTIMILTVIKEILYDDI